MAKHSTSCTDGRLVDLPIADLTSGLHVAENALIDPQRRWAHNPRVWIRLSLLVLLDHVFRSLAIQKRVLQWLSRCLTQTAGQCTQQAILFAMAWKL